MGLKAKLTAEEFGALKAELKEFYTKASDGGYILDAEGVEDVAGLKSALEAERKAKKTSNDALKLLQEKFGDLDPVKAREALEALDKQDLATLLKDGKLDEVVNKRTEKMRNDHDALVKSLNEQLKAATDEKTGLAGELGETLLRAAIAVAAPKKNVKAHAIPDVHARARGVFKVEEKKLVPYKPDGTPFYGKKGNALIDVEEWIESLQTDAPHFFEPSKGTGTPAAGSQNVQGGVIQLSREDARDPVKYRAAQAQAEKTGARVSIESPVTQ